MIFLELFWTFFRIGAFTFGGGYAMLPMFQEQVFAHGWADAETLINFIAISESTPGPFAINMATFIGSEVGGIFGSFCATLGVVLPSFLIILLVAKFFEKFRSSRAVEGCMSGLKPAVIGLIAGAVLSVGKTVFFHDGVSMAVFSTTGFYVSLAIFLLALVLNFKVKVHPILLICICAVLGIATGYLLA